MPFPQETVLKEMQPQAAGSETELEAINHRLARDLQHLQEVQEAFPIPETEFAARHWLVMPGFLPLRSRWAIWRSLQPLRLRLILLKITFAIRARFL
jgi:hypothetical protein